MIRKFARVVDDALAAPNHVLSEMNGRREVMFMADGREYAASTGSPLHGADPLISSQQETG
jgi:hypothetical protein